MADKLEHIYNYHGTVSCIVSFKGNYCAPFYKMTNKSLMSPESIWEVLAQYTPQMNLYSLLKFPLLGCEPKHVALKASELLIPEKRAELQELKLCISSASLYK